MTDWTRIPPSEPGWYFIHRKGKTDITEVWYVESDGLWTNEERGVRISPEYYKGVFWQGPIIFPPPPNLLGTPQMTHDDWKFNDRLPPQPGWYATLHSWDTTEGMFPRATEWLGERWAKSLPIFAWQGPFPDEDTAERWADEHDVER